MARMGPRNLPANPALAPAQKPARRWRRLVLLAFVASLFLLSAGRNYILVAAARFLNVSEPAEVTDYVMVLGGDDQVRPFAAAALMNAGLARKAIVATIKSSGDNLDGVVPTEHALIR